MSDSVILPGWLLRCWIVEVLRLSARYKIVWAGLWCGCKARRAIVSRVSLAVHVAVVMMSDRWLKLFVITMGTAVDKHYGGCLSLSVSVRSIGSQLLLSGYIIMHAAPHVVWGQEGVWLPAFTNSWVAHVARGTTGMQRRVDLATDLSERESIINPLTHTLTDHTYLSRYVEVLHGFLHLVRCLTYNVGLRPSQRRVNVTAIKFDILAHFWVIIPLLRLQRQTDDKNILSITSLTHHNLLVFLARLPCNVCCLFLVCLSLILYN